MRSRLILFLCTILAVGLLSGCETLDKWRARFQDQASDTVTNVTDQFNKTSESVQKKVKEVGDAAKQVKEAAEQVTEAVDAVRKIGEKPVPAPAPTPAPAPQSTKLKAVAPSLADTK